MKVVFVSSQPGAGLKKAASTIQEHAAAEGSSVQVFNLDDILVGQLVRSFPTDDPIARQEWYRLPEPCLVEAAAKAVRALAIEIEAARTNGVDVAVVFMHCVYANPETRTYSAPFDLSPLKDALGESAPAFITLQKDVYEVRQALWGKYFVREARDWRNPVRDYEDLYEVLDWRGKELVAAKQAAITTGSRFFLMHANTPVEVFWRVAVKGEPTVYLSHSISEVRRNWTRSADEKTPYPEKSAGTSFSKEVNKFGAGLRRRFAVLEPTWVDELRLIPIPKEAVALDSLKEHLLPALSQRWPLYDADRLENSPSMEDEDQKMYRVPPQTLAVNVRNDPTGVGATKQAKAGFESMMADLVYAQAKLFKDINRQITVRDFQLTDQSEVVVVFRPYNNPHAPRVSRGVVQEYKAKQRMAEHCPEKRSKIILVHPKTDELQRRALVFDGFGTDEFGKEESALDPLWRLHMEDECPPVLRAEFRKTLMAAPFPFSVEDRRIEQDIFTKIESSGQTPKIEGSSGGLAADANVKREAPMRKLAQELVKDVLLSDQVLEKAGVASSVVQIYDGNTVTADLISMISGNTTEGNGQKQ